MCDERGLVLVALFDAAFVVVNVMIYALNRD
jgi:hypothetical protein